MLPGTRLLCERCYLREELLLRARHAGQGPVPRLEGPLCLQALPRLRDLWSGQGLVLPRARLLRQASLLREGLWLCQTPLLREGLRLCQARLLCQTGLLREGLRLRSRLRLRAQVLPPDSPLPLRRLREARLL
jgi:hypothetical protein